MSHRDNRTTMLTMTALMAALTTLGTLFFRIPVGAGYIHLGDAFVVLAALALPRKHACFSAGFGAALADVVGGFAVWAPWTILVKVVAVLIIGYGIDAIASRGVDGTADAIASRSAGRTADAIANRNANGTAGSHETDHDRRDPASKLIFLYFALAAVWTALGYYIAEGVIYGNWVVPFAGIPFNLLQVAVGAILASRIILLPAFNRIK